MQIFGIAGKAGSGKDTVYLQMEKKLKEQGFRVTKLSFASKLKDVCCLLFGWDRERLEHDFDYKEGDTMDDGTPDMACLMLRMTRREIMQKVGTEAMRNGLHRDVWIIALNMAILRGEYDEYDVGVLTDCRFMNEIHFVRTRMHAHGSGKMIRIERIDDVGTLTDKVNHASETEWEQWTEWDATIQNNPSSTFPAASLDDLRNKVEKQILKPLVPGYKTDRGLAEQTKTYLREGEIGFTEHMYRKHVKG